MLVDPAFQGAPSRGLPEPCGRADTDLTRAFLLTLQVPYFNAPIYLPTKAAIGKVDEILGPISMSRRVSTLCSTIC